MNVRQEAISLLWSGQTGSCEIEDLDPVRVHRRPLGSPPSNSLLLGEHDPALPAGPLEPDLVRHPLLSSGPGRHGVHGEAGLPKSIGTGYRPRLRSTKKAGGSSRRRERGTDDVFYVVGGQVEIAGHALQGLARPEAFE